jgi:hypothetical protein
LFGSTANPITRPEVNAGPIDRNLRPANVGGDIGSRGRLPSSSPGDERASGEEAGELCGVGVGVWAAVKLGVANNAASATSTKIRMEGERLQGRSIDCLLSFVI